MFRNLVLIPLDAVSQTNFWQYREAMPTLWNLSLQSAMFQRFYSSSTSALQSFSDFMHGDAAELDHLSHWPTAPIARAGRSKNLFSALHARDYRLFGVMHGNPVPDYAERNFPGLWPDECEAFTNFEEYGDFFDATTDFLNKAKRENAPFALYYCDRVARPDDSSPEKKDYDGVFHQRFERGYSLLDDAAKRLLDRLRELDLLKETIVVVYGPYGMDPWRHDVFRGRTTGIAPYADLCWTPFFIYLQGGKIDLVDQIVSLVDLKPTLLHMLFPDEPQEPPAHPLAGINILAQKRMIALTQNLFALERENQGPALGLAKSYAVTDGVQRLIASSDGGIAGEGGMELFFDTRDPGNTRNFLDFFRLAADGSMVEFGRKDIVHVHFTRSFKPHLVESIARSYNQLRTHLKECIRFKERLADAGSDKKGMTFPESAFHRKRM